MWSDPAVTRYIGGAPSSRAEAWSRLLRYGGLWPLLGYGYWRIAETASGRFVGEAGAADFHRDLTPPFGDPETGWALATWAHGRGFALEAMTAVLKWIDHHLEAPRTVCMIDADNAPSLRLAAKLGYRQYAVGRYKAQAPLLFERPRGGS